MSCLCCLWCRIKHYLGRGDVTESDHNEHAVSPAGASASRASEAVPAAAAAAASESSPSIERDHSSEVNQVSSKDAEAETTTSETYDPGKSIDDGAMTTDSTATSAADEATQDQGFATSTQSSLLAEDEVSQEAEVEQGPDELTRIKGIGAVLEKKLHDLGITTFAQIAALDAEGIERINDQLSFKGRIEREEWVQQAKQFVNEK